MNSLIAFITIGVLSIGNSTDTADQARKLLLPQQHISNVEYTWGSPEFNYALFNEQIAAIKMLVKVGSLEDVKLLIPFLDYPGDSAYTSLGVIRPSLETIKQHWPAFAAIASIPHSEDVLSAYAINENNPLDDRLTVLLALKYQSMPTFSRCVQTLKQNNASSAKMLAYVNLIQNTPFDFGFISHKRLDRILQ